MKKFLLFLFLMGVTVSHTLSATTPDNPAFEIQPQHWNHTHAVTLNAAGSEISGAFGDGGGVSFGLSADGKVTAAAPAGAPSPVNFSAGTTSGNLGSVVFSNANGLAFQLDGSTITGSYTQSTHSHATPAYSGSNASFTAATLTFGSSNGMHFYTTNGSIVGSYTVPTQTVQTQNFIAAIVSGANGDGTYTSGTLSFKAGNNITLSTGANVFSIHGVAAQTEQTQNMVAVVGSGANGNGTFSSGTLSLKAGNNITLSTGANVISIHAGAGGAFSAGASNVGNTAGDTGITGTRLIFAGGNNITVSQATDANGATLTISGANVGGAQTGISGIVASDTTYTSGTVSFSNQANITIGSSVDGATQYIRLSGNAAQTVQTQNLFAAIVSGGNGNLTQTSGTLSFKAGNNITLSTGANVFSIHGVAAQSVVPGIQTIAFANTTFTTGAVSFSNANGISFGSSGAQVTASHNGLTTAAASNHSHGDPQLNLTNLSGTTASNSAGFTLSLSANAPGAAAENNHHHALGANTAGNTTASGSTIGLSGINLTISGTNNSVLNLSVPATSSLVGTNGISISTDGSTISISLAAVTLSGYAPYDEGVKVAGQHGQATWHVQPLQVPNFQHDRLLIEAVWSNSSNSTGSATLSFWAALYTKNVSTLSLLSSTSTSHAITFSGTGGNFSLQHGNRIVSIPWTNTITEGNYWLGVATRTTTAGGNGSFSLMCVSDANSNFSGVFGAASNATLQRRLGLGHYTASSSQVPGSIGFSQINGTASMAQRQPSIVFHSGTV